MAQQEVYYQTVRSGMSVKASPNLWLPSGLKPIKECILIFPRLKSRGQAQTLLITHAFLMEGTVLHANRQVQ